MRKWEDLSSLQEVFGGDQDKSSGVRKEYTGN